MPARANPLREPFAVKLLSVRFAHRVVKSRGAAGRDCRSTNAFIREEFAQRSMDAIAKRALPILSSTSAPELH